MNYAQKVLYWLSVYVAWTLHILKEKNKSACSDCKLCHYQYGDGPYLRP